MRKTLMVLTALAVAGCNRNTGGLGAGRNTETGAGSSQDTYNRNRMDSSQPTTPGAGQNMKTNAALPDAQSLTNENVLKPSAATPNPNDASVNAPSSSVTTNTNAIIIRQFNGRVTYDTNNSATPKEKPADQQQEQPQPEPKN